MNLNKKNNELLGIINFLKEGINSLNILNENICPLCENTINRQNLLIQLTARLGLPDSISKDSDTIRQDCLNLSSVLEDKSKNLMQIHSKLSLVSDLKQNQINSTNLQMI